MPQNALEILSEYCSDKYDIIIGRPDEGKYDRSELTFNENRSCAILGDIIPCAPWARLIKQNLFSDWVFDLPRELVKGEDMLMNIRLAFKNYKKVKLVSAKVYNYHTDNQESTLNSFKPNIEYEIMYNKFRILSIPREEQNKYIKECIISRINGIAEIINRTINECWNTEYTKETESEIKQHDLYIPLYIKLKLLRSDSLTLQMSILVNSIKIKLRRLFFH